MSNETVAREAKNVDRLEACVARIADLKRINAALVETVRHLFVCDFPEEIDFRCDGCEAARAAIALAENGGE